ncbi:glycosyltransferase family 4 protein [Psychromonas ossibalaenae]|uniref:glycosyltransferase family 4 protein n=1 Tax=Psychromonas ossibalaenae TaxID=444922 RepID=UPI0003749CDF|nr:glycosyltransferase family 4 protein [Psychromonas ossibalaenae]
MYKVKILFARLTIFILYCLIFLFALLPKKKAKKHGHIIVLTGTFYSKNWIDAHLIPIVTCSSVHHVYIVANNVNYSVEGLTVVKSPELLTKYCGDTLARLISFFICSVRMKPDYIGGFHILFNASLAVLFAKILRCRSIYFCVGGITETLAAGKTENRFFKFLDGKDKFLTLYICRIAAAADRIITMGNGAKLFLQEAGVHAANIHVISGAIDHNKFYPCVVQNGKKYDLVLTARLSKVKQVNLFLDVINKIQYQKPDCKALVIGDGPLLNDLKSYADSLNVSAMVDFAGHQDDVLSWLHQSKIYVLTSRSEGLALSMLEGLKTGLPAVVPNVGDLSDVLISGYNGFLIENHSVEDFARQILYLLNDEKLLNEYSHNALASTKRFDIECVQTQWLNVFQEPGS